MVFKKNLLIRLFLVEMVQKWDSISFCEQECEIVKSYEEN